MRRVVAVAVLGALAFAVPRPARACEHGGGPPDTRRRAALLPGLGDHHHPIATSSAEAQRFFDQGLRFVYAFNHDEAVRSFTRAVELDPRAAMPVWGVALALGPNINLDVDPAREQAAYVAVQKARGLAAEGPEHERAYIQALTRRYSDDPAADLKRLAADYAVAMRELAARYPDDLDAATLFAESLMDLRPWQLWSADGKPADGTEEIVRVLEDVLRRDPHHLGANHYYIHAVEASPFPERALPSAGRVAALAPAAGHIVHMPAHIYTRTGDHLAAARSNEEAAAVDRAYLRGAKGDGVYPIVYYTHNLQFLAFSRAMAGQAAASEKAAAEVGRRVAQFGWTPIAVAMAEFFGPTRLFVALRFQRWDAIAAAPAPDSRLVGNTALWRFARAVAFAAKGDRAKAAAEGEAFDEARKAVPADALFNLNRTDDILQVARAVLNARLAAEGDHDTAIAAWRRAVERQDALAYDEPPAWYYPTRESLGGALLAAGRPGEAEAVFRDDLKQNPRNGRSLFGLEQALRAQQNTVAADDIARLFRTAWAKADVKLTVGNL